MSFVEFIATLSLFQLLSFGYDVILARRRTGVKAPAISGNSEFDSYYRVHMNTVELLVIFLPSLFISAKYWPSEYSALVGFIYLIGRFIYARAYVKDPTKRSLGFKLSIFPVLILLGISLFGSLGLPNLLNLSNF